MRQFRADVGTNRASDLALLRHLDEVSSVAWRDRLAGRSIAESSLWLQLPPRFVVCRSLYALWLWADRYSGLDIGSAQSWQPSDVEMAACDEFSVWSRSRWVKALPRVILAVCAHEPLRYQVLLDLGLSVASLWSWVFRASGRSRRLLGGLVERLHHMVSLGRGCLLIAWQLRQGHLRVSHARRKMISLPEDISCCLSQRGKLEAALHSSFVLWFVMSQHWSACGANRLESHVYVLCGRVHTYIGFTQRRWGASAGASVLPRFWEHMQDAHGQVPASRARCWKSRCFAMEHAAEMFVVISASGHRDRMVALEVVAIRALRPSGNAMLAGPGRSGPRHSKASRRRRGRPPARLRCSRGAPACLAVTCHSKTMEVLAKEGRTSFGADVKRSKWALCHLPFAECYKRVQRLALAATGCCGPLFIMNPDLLPLLVSWVTTRSSKVCWRCIMHGDSGRGRFYSLGMQLNKVCRPGRHQTGAHRWALASKTWGELPWHLPALRVPDVLDQGLRASLVCDLRRLAGLGCCWRRRWLARCLHVVPVPWPTHAQKCFNMVQPARGMVVADLDSMPAEWKQAAEPGTDMVREKKFWKTKVECTKPQVLRLSVDMASNWCEALGRGYLDARFVRGTWQAWLDNHSNAELEPPVAANPLAEVFCAATCDETLCVEDKDTAAAWRQRTDCYQWRLLSWLRRDSDRWRRSYQSVADLEKSLVQLHAPLVARGLVPKRSPGCWTGNVPYMYITIKAKCWTMTGDVCQHTCEKPGHACVRKICSWIRHPYRNWLRRVGRAARVLLLSLRFGDAVPNLKRAAPCLLERVGRLSAPRDASCDRCGACVVARWRSQMLVLCMKD